MKLTDKRFWKFEAFTFLYAIGLILLVGFLFDKPIPFERTVYFSSLFLLSGLVAWLVANGKHWFVFGIVYEIIFMILWALMLAVAHYIEYDSLNHAIEDGIIDACVFVYLLVVPAIVMFIPSLVLAFFGYHLINKNSRDNEFDKNVIS